MLDMGDTPKTKVVASHSMYFENQQGHMPSTKGLALSDQKETWVPSRTQTALPLHEVKHRQQSLQLTQAGTCIQVTPEQLHPLLSPHVILQRKGCQHSERREQNGEPHGAKQVSRDLPDEMPDGREEGTRAPAGGVG